jgi:hypothetical protein
MRYMTKTGRKSVKITKLDCGISEKYSCQEAEAERLKVTLPKVEFLERGIPSADAPARTPDAPGGADQGEEIRLRNLELLHRKFRALRRGRVFQ